MYYVFFVYKRKRSKNDFFQKIPHKTVHLNRIEGSAKTSQIDQNVVNVYGTVSMLRCFLISSADDMKAD